MRHLDPRAPLGRLGYVLWGVSLASLKFALDALLANVFGHPYSLLFYVDPSSAPLMHAGVATPYWSALCCVMVPFAALGVTLTVRRLRDAGASPWLALFFFVPFANLLFFLATALLPRVRRDGVQRMPPASPFRGMKETEALPGKPRSRAVAILYAATLGSVVALGGFAVSVGLLGKYGYGLALGTPMISGFVGGAFLPRLRPEAKSGDAALVTALTFVLSMAFVVLFALEGMGCLVLFVPLLFLPALLGSAIGFAMGKSMPAREHALAMGGGMTLLLLTFGVEATHPSYVYSPSVVETTIDIAAAPDVVWANTVSVADMPEPTNFPFTAGIAYPIRATLETAAVGGVRTCEFNTGFARETVTAYDAGKRLRFTIDSQPDPLRELTLYHTVHQPHLDSAIRNRVGEFELLSLDGGMRTRLIGRSWYELRIAPSFYWIPYSNFVVHAIHTRVLGAIKDRSETSTKVAYRRF